MTYRTGVDMNRHVVAGWLAMVMFVAVAPAAQANRSPESKAGVIHAAQRDPRTCARAVTPAASIAHGIAELAVHQLVGRTCANGGPGCVEIWGYTGSDWGVLGWCSRDVVTYPTRLPGRIAICHGTSYTLVRSGPGFNYLAVARVTTNTVVGADRARLTVAARKGVDGVAWYRINWHGHAAWVVSYRVTSKENGCANWAAYWAYMHHR